MIDFGQAASEKRGRKFGPTEPIAEELKKPWQMRRKGAKLLNARVTSACNGTYAASHDVRARKLELRADRLGTPRAN